MPKILDNHIKSVYYCCRTLVEYILLGRYLMLIKLTKHELKGSGNVTLCLGTLLFVTILIANNLISIKNMAKTILTIPFIENSPMLILVALASILLVAISSRIMWREFESEKIYLLLTTPPICSGCFWC